MIGWKKYTLGEVGKITTGKTPKTDNEIFFGGEIHFVTPADLRNSCKYIIHTERTLSFAGLESVYNNHIVQNSICVSCIGNLGYVGVTTMDCVSNQQINSIEVNKKFDRDYVYYAIRNLRPYFKNLEGQSTTVSILNKRQFSRIEIFAPCIDEQKRIAGILGALDDKIELNRRINANLEEQIKNLYRQWFEDNPNPEWRIAKLSDIATFIGGYSYKGSELTGTSNIAMATIKNFRRYGGFKTEGFKDIIPSTKLKAEQHAELFDILVAHTDLTQNADVIGNAELLLTSGGYKEIVFSMDLVKVMPKEIFPYKFLLATLLKNPVFKAHCIGYVNGTTVLHLNKQALPNYDCQIPCDADAAVLDKMLSSYYRKMSEILHENERLATIRDTLLPKLMNDKI